MLAVDGLLAMPFVRWLGIGCAVVLVVVLGILVPVVGQLNRRQVSADVGAPGLYGIVGRFGSGKSLFMAWLVVVANKGDRQVLTNCGMKGARQYASWLELMWLADDGALVMMDEVSLWWPAGNLQPPQLLDAWIRQLRKRKVTMCWASQGWGHVGKRLRDLTFAVWVARSVAGHHVYTLHEASQMARPTHGEHTTKLHVKRTRQVREAYDTFELVEPGGWDDVPKGVTVEQFLRASGRVPLGKGLGWSPRPADGPDLNEWLASLPRTGTGRARDERTPVSAVRARSLRPVSTN